MDTRPFTSPSPPGSGNGHRSSSGIDGLHYYSPRDDDRETTRYLSAATQISLEYARRVVRKVIHEPYRALAPAYGADVAIVARWALDSLHRRAQRDMLLAATLVGGGGLCWLFFAFLFPRLLWTSVAILITLTAAFIIIVHEHWVRVYQILGRRMCWDRFDPSAAPSSAEPKVNERLQAVADRRDGNLVVFREHAAFTGSGRKLGREQLVIDVSRGKPADDGTPTEPGHFTNAEVHTALLKAVNKIKLHDLRAVERVYVNGRHVRGNRELQRHPLEPPFSSVGPELLLKAAQHPTPDARAYVCAETHGWQGQLVVTMFARAVHAGGWLYIEYGFYSLPPIKPQYMLVDWLYEESWIRKVRKVSIWSLRRTIPALIISPYALAREAADKASWKAHETAQAYRIGHGQAFDYGALPSIREDAAGVGRQHYFLARDEIMFLLLLQKSLLREIGKFLDEHNIASEEFEEQAKIIIDASNKNYSIHVGSVSGSTVAFGENARASTTGGKANDSGRSDPDEKRSP